MADTPFDRLGRELEVAAERQVAAAPGAAGSPPESAPERPPRRRRRSLGLFGAVIAVPVLAATAWAASALISTGSPVAYRDGAPVSGVGVGAPVAGSVKLLTTSVADPDGGLPWGLRSFRTTRGLVCLQVGRVYEGKLGVLGRNGSFKNDGRFHELRPGVVANQGECFPPDGAGNAYLTFHYNGYLASGEPCRLAACIGTVMGGEVPGPPAPPLRQRRAIDFGLLGPKATRVTYRDTDATRTKATLGAEGGYLIVRRPLPATPLPAGMRRPRGVDFVVNAANEYFPAMTPASRVVVRVQYGRAGHCNVRARTSFRASDPDGGCPDPPGFVPIPRAQPTAVRTKVTARAVGTKEIRVRFKARVAVVDRLTAYSVTVYPERTLRRCRAVRGQPKPAPGALCGLSTGDTTDRNIPAGRTIIKDIGLFRRPPGRYRVVVSLLAQPSHPSPGGLFGPPGMQETPVGRTTVVVR